MSGDMNTGLGNCLLMCAMLYSYFMRLRFSFDVINNGDDCGIIFSRHDMDKFNALLCQNWFLTMGFQMEIEKPVYIIEEIEFCQSHPVCVDGEWIMLRNPDAATSKDCISTQKLDNIYEWCSHWDAVGKCGMALSSGMPMNQAYYTRLVEIAAANKPTNYKEGKTYNNVDLNQYGFFQMASGLKFKHSEIKDSTRISFWKATGIIPDIQIAQEKEYAQIQINTANIQINSALHECTTIPYMLL